MAREDPQPRLPIEGGTSAVNQLLAASQYERAAELLRKAQTASQQLGNAGLAHTLNAASRICVICRQCRSDAESHQQAYSVARRQEQELVEELHAILVHLGSTDALGSPDKEPHRAAMSLPEPGNPALATNGSLWQRIRSLLEISGPERELSPSAIEEQVQPLVDEAEALTKQLTVPDRAAMTVSPAANKQNRERQDLPSLVVYCLGPFRVYQDDQPVTDWPNCKGKSIFKYLVTHRQRPVPKEVLMELFWPGAKPHAARNNLNVAIYGLRRVLLKACPSCSHVLFQGDCYLLNPNLQIWVDSEAFMEHYATALALEERGEQGSAIHEYREAEALYTGEFLEEDRYEDWLTPPRQDLKDNYLNLLDRLSRYYFDKQDYDACAVVCNKMLVVDACHEDAHRQLMQCYSRKGQLHLALRQYHLCIEALARELDVYPSQSTTELFEKVRSRAHA